MFESYTAEARQVVTLAQEEARALRGPEIGSGHLLLGVLRTLPLLVPLRIEDVRARLPTGDAPEDVALPFSGAAQRALEVAPKEAAHLGHERVTPTRAGLARPPRAADRRSRSSPCRRGDPARYPRSRRWWRRVAA